MNLVQNTTAINTAAPISTKVNTQVVKVASTINSGGLDLKEIQDIVRQNKEGEMILSVPEKAIATAIEHINKIVSGANIELRHSIHKATNTVMVTLVDKDTNDVVLEIPPQNVLDAYVERMTLNGLFLDERR